MIICITGMPGSGKTIVAEILGKEGFQVYEMSRVLKDMMIEEGLEITVPNIEKFAIQKRKEKGWGVFAVELVKRMDMSGDEKVAISGMRSEEELSYFKKHLKGLVAVAISAPVELRYERLKNRKAHKIKGFDEFKLREEANKEEGVDGVMEHADYIISNTGTENELRKNIEELLSHLK